MRTGEPLGLTKPEGYRQPRAAGAESGQARLGGPEERLCGKELGKAGPGGQRAQGTPTSFHMGSRRPEDRSDMVSYLGDSSSFEGTGQKKAGRLLLWGPQRARGTGTSAEMCQQDNVLLSWGSPKNGQPGFTKEQAPGPAPPYESSPQLWEEM